MIFLDPSETFDLVDYFDAADFYDFYDFFSGVTFLSWDALGVAFFDYTLGETDLVLILSDDFLEYCDDEEDAADFCEDLALGALDLVILFWNLKIDKRNDFSKK